MKKELAKLVKIAEVIGRHPDFVQGGGGNLSVKLDERKMLIKASGLRFSELSLENGFVLLDYPKLAVRYGKISAPEREGGEKKEADFLLACVLPFGISGRRPSMEAGFHAFLGKYVLHTHSVYTNILACAAAGEGIAEDICSRLGFSFAHLPYFHPGAELAIGIGKLTDRGVSAPDVIFLKNHGIIISADSSEKLLDLHEKLNGAVKNFLKLKPYPLARIKLASIAPADARKFRENIIFPDQAIFAEGFGAGSDSGQALAVEELFRAWSYVCGSIAELGMPVSTIPDEAVNYLQNMEAEKHRKTTLA
jgi:rhamnose utilization protein RhaD (predicted bifunctional aldolase and dehydrogenase)